MTIRRWSITGLVAVSLLTPGLAACKIGMPQPAAEVSATPAIPADPKQALLASTEEISKGNFRYTMAADQTTGGGVVHMPSRSAQLKMRLGDPSSDFFLDLDLIYIEPDSWVKVKIGGSALKNLPGLEKLPSGKYLHLDQSKIKDIKDLRFDFSDVDPAGSELLTKAIVDVRQTGEGGYAGNLDLSKATNAGLVDQGTIKALGVRASKLPFEAQLDPQGRLTELTIKVPAAGRGKAHELKVTYADYGAASQPTKPAASEIEEAPAETYDLFK